jgi:DNA-directed RNA polymerase subunit N (RpoN/RPB10)
LFEIGDTVYLKSPYRGYTCGEIVDYQFPYYIVRFSSGMETSFYSDEFEEKK